MPRLLVLSVVLCLIGCAASGKPKKDAGRAPAPAQAVFWFYDQGLNHLSAVRSGTCPMHPSCSVYSRESFQKHGLLLGWWMTFDRLLRCGRDEIDRSPSLLVGGQWKAHDPVSHNDHWWHEPREDRSSGRFSP